VTVTIHCGRQTLYHDECPNKVFAAFPVVPLDAPARAPTISVADVVEGAELRLFDFVFIGCFLFVVIYSLRIVWSLIRRRSRIALRQIRRLAIFVIVYLMLDISVALASPQKVFRVGDTRCFDDWCISVEEVKTTEVIGPNVHPARGRFLLVTLRVSSRAGRVRQSAPDALVYLVDASGNRFDVADSAQEAFERSNGRQTALTSMLDPQTSFPSVRVFDVPSDLQEIGLAVRHGAWPGWFVIGDDGSFFHKTPIFLIPLHNG
jgi:hypothetical protein